MFGPRPTVVAPFVHMNGTSKEELLELREKAYSAIDNALEALRNMGPNGRDYYPDPGRMEKAVAQHRRRMKTFTDMMDELEAECDEIQRVTKP